MKQPITDEMWKYGHEFSAWYNEICIVSMTYFIICEHTGVIFLTSESTQLSRPQTVASRAERAPIELSWYWLELSALKIAIFGNANIKFLEDSF